MSNCSYQYITQLFALITRQIIALFIFYKNTKFSIIDKIKTKHSSLLKIQSFGFKWFQMVIF